jgi:extracellular factor (EF) 3-hydroxypalmitic acid methyl ester biosynthesis protein
MSPSRLEGRFYRVTAQPEEIMRVTDGDTATSNDVALVQQGSSRRADEVLMTLAAACDEFLALDERAPIELLHATASSLHRFAASILACEREGVDRAALLPHLAPVRALHSRSPFVQRLQTWPRGHAGDFETVEWMCEARNRAPFGSVGWAIEECALQSPVAQQHRNKIAIQAAAVLATLRSNGGGRIASLGCGGCRDLMLIKEDLSCMKGEFVLVDGDAEALAFSRTQLAGLAERCRFVHGTVPRVLSRLASAAPFDLVVAGGLFDYLPDRAAVVTLRAIRRLLGPGGRLLFSNIARGNPFRPWLEYLAEWRLIERQEPDVRDLLAVAGFETSPHIFRDASGLSLMVDVRCGNECARGTSEGDSGESNAVEAA